MLDSCAHRDEARYRVFVHELIRIRLCCRECALAELEELPPDWHLEVQRLGDIASPVRGRSGDPIPATWSGPFTVDD